ncbi:hypothetical protein MIND_00249100 [Mycena indigotica]|uniref:Uncharacterized protein n=1 Tax=Mycena indigotica TaxID=2126181 RepID=A0A8H6T7J6_9AGAR|nr:uncharacterized protein MIND_00249100 [Mycena indigotica]KAF7312360.1 hypothetical protein MIND_00249100 [Mycena indigotica]
MISARCVARQTRLQSTSAPFKSPITILEAAPPPFLPAKLYKRLGPKSSKLLAGYAHAKDTHTIFFYHNPDVPHSVAQLDVLKQAHAQKEVTRVPHAPLRFRLAIHHGALSQPMISALLEASKQPWLDFVVPRLRNRPDVTQAAFSGDYAKLSAILAEDWQNTVMFPISVVYTRRDSARGFHSDPETTGNAAKPVKTGKKRFWPVPDKEGRIFAPSPPPIYVGPTAGTRTVIWLQYERRKIIGRGQLGQLKGAERLYLKD